MITHVRSSNKSSLKVTLRQVAVPLLLYLGLDATEPVFWVSDKVSFKPVSSATETS